MIVDLTDTTAAAIGSALTRARHSTGSPASGMVLTLVVVIDESGHYDALRAATESAREHPSRILTVVPRGGRGPARLDAEVRVGGESGPGETVLMRLYGELSRHAASVITPLLLPDAPVVTWWPGLSPDSLHDDPLGQLSQRRISDSATDENPLAALTARGGTYTAGDTDLTWTRATPWRTNLAAALDQPYDPIRGARVEAEQDNASAELLALWLETRLGITVQRGTSPGPGITGVSLEMDRGSISLTRPDGRVATLSRPGQPNRRVALPRRELPDLLAEELRRLDPDEVYAETVANLGIRTEEATSVGSSELEQAVEPTPTTPEVPAGQRSQPPVTVAPETAPAPASGEGSDAADEPDPDRTARVPR